MKQSVRTGDNPVLDVRGIARLLRVTEKTVYNRAPGWPFMTKLEGSRLWRAYRNDVVAAVRKGLLDGMVKRKHGSKRKRRAA